METILSAKKNDITLVDGDKLVLSRAMGRNGVDFLNASYQLKIETHSNGAIAISHISIRVNGLHSNIVTLDNTIKSPLKGKTIISLAPRLKDEEEIVLIH